MFMYAPISTRISSDNKAEGITTELVNNRQPPNAIVSKIFLNVILSNNCSNTDTDFRSIGTGFWCCVCNQSQKIITDCAAAQQKTQSLRQYVSSRTRTTDTQYAADHHRTINDVHITSRTLCEEIVDATDDLTWITNFPCCNTSMTKSWTSTSMINDTTQRSSPIVGEKCCRNFTIDAQESDLATSISPLCFGIRRGNGDIAYLPLLPHDYATLEKSFQYSNSSSDCAGINDRNNHGFFNALLDLTDGAADWYYYNTEYTAKSGLEGISKNNKSDILMGTAFAQSSEQTSLLLHSFTEALVLVTFLFVLIAYAVR